MTIKTVPNQLLIAVAATALASGLTGYVWHEQHRQPLLEVYIFSLKSGRSMFIRTPDDQRILIDGGGTSEIIRHLTDIIPFYSRRIDKVIITNTDGKNVSGLIDVLMRYDVDRVYIPKYTLENLGIASSTDKIYETFVGVLAGTEIHLDEISKGDQIPLNGSHDGEGDSDIERATANVIFPVAPEQFDYSKASAPEVLFNISYGDTSIIFMGDASKKVQKFVVSSSAEIIGYGDVLVVSHSAIPANMSSEFMNAVQPDFLVYERTITKSPLNSSKSTKSNTKKTSSSNKKISKKVVADPLAAILDDQRFNLKEVGTVKIVSDGKEVTITGSKR